MKLEWTNLNDERDSRVADYRGHTITIELDINAGSPRDDEDDWKFVSIDRNFTTPDDSQYFPEEEFYIDIYQFATEQWGELSCGIKEDIQEAYQYVEENLIVYPIGGRCDSVGTSLYIGNQPTLEDELDGKSNRLLGAIFISKEKAREYYGVDKTDRELYELMEHEVVVQLKEYAFWAEGETDILDVAPNEKISFLLNMGGDETREIASDWERRAQYWGGRIWGRCDTNGEEVAESVRDIDEIADWLISELDKLDSNQFNPAMKANVIKLLTKSE